MRVNCDVCARNFEPVLAEEKLVDGSVGQSFVCTHCGTVYPVARLTRRGVQLRDEIQDTSDAEKLRQLRTQLKGEIFDERGRARE